MPQKFFITHSWKDIDFARKLSDDLCASGLDGFLDAHSMNPGDSIPSRIERGLKECDVYIPIFSLDALKSDWCDWEIDMAITMNRTRKGRPRIIPVIAKPCDVPDRLMHILHISFVGRYNDALNELLTKGFGLPAMPLSVVVVPPAPPAVSARTQSLPSWLVPVAVAVFVVGACIISGAYVIGIVTSQPTVTPTVAVAGAPTTIVPTVTLTNTPTMSPKPADTVRPMATFTPQPTDTPRPTVSTTPGVGTAQERGNDKAEMVYVPSGEFVMGTNSGNSDEKPPHVVFLDTFWIDKYEVTNGLYKKCVDAGKCQPPNPTRSYRRESYFGNTRYDGYPAVYVSWRDASVYCVWAGKRLPTEAEWEKAAGGVEGRRYPWGSSFDGIRLNSSDAVPQTGDTTAVGIYQSGSSYYGAMDMAGNVWEWIADWYDANYYANSPRSNPSGPTSGITRVARGGSLSSNYFSVRVQMRLSVNSESRFYDLGFRCAQ